VATVIFSSTSSDVILTLVAGRVLFHRELTTLDETELQGRVNASLARIGMT